MRENSGNSKGVERFSSKSEFFFYEIKVQGQLSQAWSEWFEGMTITVIEDCECGMACTLISGPVIDQPALHGLLNKIRDLNLPLVSVRRYLPGTNRIENVLIKLE